MPASILRAHTALKGRVRHLAAGLWPSVCRSVPSVECVLVCGVLVAGLVPGLVAAYNAIGTGRVGVSVPAPADYAQAPTARPAR